MFSGCPQNESSVSRCRRHCEAGQAGAALGIHTVHLEIGEAALVSPVAPVSPDNVSPWEAGEASQRPLPFPTSPL